MKKVLTVVLTLIITFASVSAFSLKTSAAETTRKAGKVTLSSGRLNIRSGSSTNSARLASVVNGSYLTLVSKNGSWWYVEYEKDKYGYCHADYITVLGGEAANVKLSSGRLNVRSGEGTSYSIKDTLQNGAAVLVLSSSNGWSHVLYNGSETGYVSSKYLSFGVKYSAVSLSVPSYKQTDSRWANVKLGTSGKTIAQIGCATTAIAMAESYRTGTTIYPDAMSKKLKYTSSGSVYWPSNYTSVGSISGYMSKMYDMLKSGKPVLIGLKNNNGAQHWVVITGYLGGDTLKASLFTVNDPGSKTRNDLQDLINVYPYFYKYLYY